MRRLSQHARARLKCVMIKNEMLFAEVPRVHWKFRTREVAVDARQEMMPTWSERCNSRPQCFQVAVNCREVAEPAVIELGDEVEFAVVTNLKHVNDFESDRDISISCLLSGSVN